MVARTICEDSVLNHRSKLPWMKRQSTNCQEQVTVDIYHERTTMDEPFNQITTVDMFLRYCCHPCVNGVVELATVSLEPWQVMKLEVKPGAEHQLSRVKRVTEVTLARLLLGIESLLPLGLLLVVTYLVAKSLLFELRCCSESMRLHIGPASSTLIY
ncbi:unnamed protein product [Brassica oleracea]